MSLCDSDSWGGLGGWGLGGCSLVGQLLLPSASSDREGLVPQLLPECQQPLWTSHTPRSRLWRFLRSFTSSDHSRVGHCLNTSDITSSQIFEGFGWS
uniref:Uncharacterized protein n=1 Tax=Knipowitschia caucasica TaxID=637954 RepID=A0AAV2ITB4_KNICA